MARVTLGDIAEACGISKYGVSRALSGKSGVSEETRRRVLEAAERLGYQRPQPRRRPVIAALFEDPAHVNGELHSKIQSGMQAEASRLGFDVQPHWLYHGDRIGALIDSCDGIAAINIQDRAVLRRVREAGQACRVQRLARPSRFHRHRLRHRPRIRRRGRSAPA